METIYQEVKEEISHWWISLIVGILLIGISLLLIFWPVEGYGAVTVIFSLSVMAAGLFEIFFSWSNRKSLKGWGWYLAAGIAAVILGVAFLLLPLVTATMIPFLLGFWIMFSAAMVIGFSFQLEAARLKSWVWYLVFGIVAGIVSLIILLNPYAGATMTLFLVSLGFMCMGLYRIIVAFELKKIYKCLDEKGADAV